MKKLQIVMENYGTETMLQCIEGEDNVSLSVSVTHDGENVPIQDSEMCDVVEAFSYGLGEQMAAIISVTREHFNPSGILLPPTQPDLFEGGGDASHLRIIK